ncbi:MAG: hypothetical protein QM754_17535 [Tepidisphaeraceae bacterium]
MSNESCLRSLAKATLAQVASIVTPEMILGWHHKLISANFDSSNKRAEPMGHPPTDPLIVQHILPMAPENAAWGYLRITDELAKLEITVSRQTVKNILEHHGLDPDTRLKNKTSWHELHPVS